MPGGAHENMRVWEPEEDHVIMSMWEQGGPRWKEIARALQDRTVSSVRNRHQRIMKARSEPRGRNRCQNCGEFKRGHTCRGRPPQVTLTRNLAQSPPRVSNLDLAQAEGEGNSVATTPVFGSTATPSTSTAGVRWLGDPAASSQFGSAGGFFQELSARRDILPAELCDQFRFPALQAPRPQSVQPEHPEETGASSTSRSGRAATRRRGGVTERNLPQGAGLSTSDAVPAMARTISSFQRETREQSPRFDNASAAPQFPPFGSFFESQSSSMINEAMDIGLGAQQPVPLSDLPSGTPLPVPPPLSKEWSISAIFADGWSSEQPPALSRRNSARLGAAEARDVLQPISAVPSRLMPHLSRGASFDLLADIQPDQPGSEDDLPPALSRRSSARLAAASFGQQ